jgi:D-beta-D-heptose 7-phosphate kinase / D-beta-D-heptose 1-phosphate adenosyltransferase
MIKINKVKDILKKAEDQPVLACGDVMLDAYMTGTVERLSQEAPVPVIAVDDEKFFPGGAGNAAACMAAIKLIPHLVAVVGKKERISYSSILREECARDGIVSHFCTDPGRKTTLKLRLAAVKTTKQHIARVDIEDCYVLDAYREKEVIHSMERLFSELKPKVLSIHDYKKGFLTKNVFVSIVKLSAKNKIPVFADIKQDTFVNFRKLITAPELFYLKPNRIESAETAKALNGFDKNGNSDEEIVEIARIIQKEIPVRIFITRGRKGAVYFKPGEKPYFVRVEEAEEQFDVAGAGDTVAAFLIAAYLGGASMPEALEMAMVASQVAIRKFGTSVVTEAELLNWMEKNEKNSLS